MTLDFAAPVAAPVEQRIPGRVRWTYVLIALNVLVSLLTTPEVYSFGANNQAQVLHGSLYRLLTSMFLHSGVEHLALNMLALWSVGRLLEAYTGPARFLTIYLVGGLIGSVTSAALNGPLITSVGASGAVFALFGSAIIYFSRFRAVFGPEARKHAPAVLSTVLLNLANGLLPGSRIDNWAHVGGLIGGMAVTQLLCSFITIYGLPSPQSGQGAVWTKREYRALAAGDSPDPSPAIDPAPTAAAIADQSLTETRPGATRAIARITIATVLLFSATVFIPPAGQALTLQNIWVTVPPMWITMTDFQGVEECATETEGVSQHCVLQTAPFSGGETWIEIIRFVIPDLPPDSVEVIDQGAAQGFVEGIGPELSREAISINGRTAVRRVHGSLSGNGRATLIVLVQDGPSILRIIAQSPSYASYSGDFDRVVESIRFTGDFTP